MRYFALLPASNTDAPPRLRIDALRDEFECISELVRELPLAAVGRRKNEAVPGRTDKINQGAFDLVGVSLVVAVVCQRRLLVRGRRRLFCGFKPSASANLMFRWAMRQASVHLSLRSGLTGECSEAPHRARCWMLPQGHCNVTQAMHGSVSGHAAGAWHFSGQGWPHLRGFVHVWLHGPHSPAWWHVCWQR